MMLETIAPNEAPNSIGLDPSSFYWLKSLGELVNRSDFPQMSFVDCTSFVMLVCGGRLDYHTVQSNMLKLFLDRGYIVDYKVPHKPKKTKVKLRLV